MLSDYSDPRVVVQKAKRLGLVVEPSSRPTKKYMLKGKRTVHFGQMGYADYTKHRDKKRRDRFRTRNNKWKHSPKNSPAYLAYHLLW